MIESRAYDNEHGDPVVVLVVTGTHDVSRLVNLFMGGANLCEHMAAADRILSQVKRHNGGSAALKLLKDHGGLDFTGEEPALPDVVTPDVQAAIRKAIADPGALIPRGREYEGSEVIYETLPRWQTRAVLAVLSRAVHVAVAAPVPAGDAA